jgi:hypothetical protein
MGGNLASAMDRDQGWSGPYRLHGRDMEAEIWGRNSHACCGEFLTVFRLLPDYIDFQGIWASRSEGLPTESSESGDSRPGIEKFCIASINQISVLVPVWTKVNIRKCANLIQTDRMFVKDILRGE